MAVHAYTSFSYSYLDRARVFARSLKKHHPDWILWAVLVDKEPPGFTFDWSTEDFDRVVTIEELFGNETNRWLFGHDIVEACTAVKGKALEHILSVKNVDKVFYFDPDNALFNPMTPVVDMLDDHSIVLTPHQVDPEPASDQIAIRDNEIASLDYGIFNLGFVAVRNDAEARRFASWWADRLHDWCHDRRDIGVFVDQKWCNLVPCFFDSVKVLRDPGYNVASWNISQREIAISSDGQITANGEPLRFYHFTKLGPTGAQMTYRYARGRIDVFELWWWYRNEVQLARDARVPQNWWHYGTFTDGTRIPKKVRELFRENEDLQKKYDDPYDAAPGGFPSWARRHTSAMKTSR